MPRRPDRRRFLTTLATGAAVPLAGPAAAQSAPARDETAALMDIVRRRFGRHLDDDQLKAVEDDIRQNLLLAEALKRVRLDPTDEPATVFLPDVED